MREDRLRFDLMKRALVFAVALALVACGKLKEPTSPLGGGGDPIDPTATFTRVQAEVFTPNCTRLGCHDLLGRQEDQVLVASQSYNQTVNHPSVEMPSLSRVTPLDPASSYLYRKITGAGITGDRMPQGGPYLSDAQIKLVRDWIRRGAPND
jgi:hypothetical protein